MRPNIPNQKKAYDALNRRLVNYVAQVQSIYDRIASQVATAIDGVVMMVLRSSCLGTIQN